MIRNLSSIFLAGAVALGTLSCGTDTPSPFPPSEDKPRREASNTKKFSEHHSFSVIHQWIEGPYAGDSNNRLQITFEREDGQIPENIVINQFVPFMPIHGHGTEMKFQTVEVVGNRAFIDGIRFIMAGGPRSWVIFVDATVDGIEDTVEIEIDQAVTPKP